jgi:hypothetical protein
LAEKIEVGVAFQGVMERPWPELQSWRREGRLGQRASQEAGPAYLESPGAVRVRGEWVPWGSPCYWTLDRPLAVYCQRRPAWCVLSAVRSGNHSPPSPPACRYKTASAPAETRHRSHSCVRWGYKISRLRRVEHMRAAARMGSSEERSRGRRIWHVLPQRPGLRIRSYLAAASKSAKPLRSPPRRLDALSFRKSSRFSIAFALNSGSGVSARIRART